MLTAKVLDFESRRLAGVSRYATMVEWLSRNGRLVKTLGTPNLEAPKQAAVMGSIHEASVAQ
jgi:hypothetical protein